MPNLKVATEVWINVAEMEKEEIERGNSLPVFSTKEIISRLLDNNYYGDYRPGVATHISQHCVSNKPPSSARYSMLVAADKDGTANPKGEFRRLYRDTDGHIDTGRNKEQRIPLLNEVPTEGGLQEKVKELITWWSGLQGLEVPTLSQNTLTKAEQENQIRLSGDIYPFLLKFNRGYLIDDIKTLNIIDHDGEGNKTDKFLNRAVTVKVGYALSIFKELGISEEFEEYLKPHRTIKPSYGHWFDEHQKLSAQSNRLAGNLQTSPIANRQGPVRIKLQDHIYAFLAEYGHHLVIDEINNFELKKNADRSYHDRSMTIKIGFAINRIRELGLIGELEHFLPGGIDPRYITDYEKYTNTNP